MVPTEWMSMMDLRCAWNDGAILDINAYVWDVFSGQVQWTYR